MAAGQGHLRGPGLLLPALASLQSSPSGAGHPLPACTDTGSRGPLLQLSAQSRRLCAGTSIPGMPANPPPSSGIFWNTSLSAWQSVGVGGDYVPRVPPWAYPTHDRRSSPVCSLALLTAEFGLWRQCPAASKRPPRACAQSPLESRGCSALLDAFSFVVHLGVTETSYIWI